MLVLESVTRVESNFVPGNGEEVYDTVTKSTYRGNGYTPVGQLVAVSSAPQKALSLPGTANNYVSTPDANVFDITGDLCLMAKVKSNGVGSDSTLICKWQSGTAKSYWFHYYPDANLLVFNRSSDGTTDISFNVPFNLNISSYWVAVTYKANNGAGGNDVKFWSSLDGANWTQIGITQTTAGVAPIFASTSIVELGSAVGGAAVLFGGIYYEAKIYNGIGANTAPGQGTMVGHWVANQADVRYKDEFNNIWTVNGASSSWTPVTPPTGTALYLPGIANNAVYTPDSNNLDVMGDTEFVFNVAANDWTPSAPNVLISKWKDAGSQHSYILGILPGGHLYFQISSNGTDSSYGESPANCPFNDGQFGWVKMTRQISGGVVSFYTAPNQNTEPSLWTLLGTSAAIPFWPIYTTTADAIIGSREYINEVFSGLIKRVIIRNSINGSIVAEYNANNNDNPYRDINGNSWYHIGTGWSKVAV